MNEKDRYEAIVIGSGQGGTPLATALSKSGMKTALVEMRHVGGTCVNYGCTPTKTMISSARVAHLLHRAAEYGVALGSNGNRVDLGVVRRRKRDIVASFRGGSERNISQSKNLTLLRGRATFVDSHTIAVRAESGESTVIEAPRIFINTGTRPHVPDLPGLSEVGYLDNETIMELDTVPEHLVVIGGGYIGVELGQMFRRFGSKVTIVQRQAKLLPREDDDISDAVAELLRSEGAEVIVGAEPLSIAKPAGVSPGERTSIQLELRENGKARTVSGSHVLFAAGRTPNSDGIGLEEIGIKLDGHGYITVNERLETGVPGVWALGDVKGGPAFTHISYDDYRILYRNVVEGASASIAGRLVPYTVFIDPQLGRVGMSEREARAAGRKIRVASMPMSWVARALETDESVGLMKAVVDTESNQILGFSMLGIEAGEVAGAVQIAMMGKLPYTALRDGVFSHPTTLESLNNLFAQLTE